MLLALLWWAVLLQRKNTENFVLQTQLLQHKFTNSVGVMEFDVSSMPEYEEIKEEHERQMMMIYGETVVFALTLIMGIYFINKAYTSELLSSEKQKNFLLSITHELKSPLASINLIFSTFKKRQLSQDKITELSEDGLKESVRLEKLFNKILISTRLGKGYSFQIEAHNLSNLIKETVMSFHKNHPDVQITANIQEGVIKDIDKEGMISVITNLLENAEKYSGNDKAVEVTLKENGDQVYISIADNGVGIDKKEYSKIFDQFYRVGNEDTRSTKGTGLGLYIVNQIIAGHQGKVSVTDHNGNGTKFEILL